MRVDLSNLTAHLHVENLAIEDAGTLQNALQRGPTVPATVRYDVRWSGFKQLSNVHDTTNHFAGVFFVDDATAEWSASESGFRFVSDPANTSKSLFAEIGFEHNGVFFS